MQVPHTSNTKYPRSWRMILVSLLPLWLVSLAVTVEGFPRPPIPGWLGVLCFVGFVISSPLLLWKKIIPVELVLASLLPFYLLPTFDEITTTYKTPFIFICALLLTLGFIAYQRSNNKSLRWLFLLASLVLMVWAALHAADAFWQLTSSLGYRECFPDYPGCAPLTGNEPAWWQLFFGGAP